MQRAPKVFIDGQAGTTGLRIRDLLSAREDLDVIEIEQARRKDAAARAERLNECDVAILCLPDEAARQAVAAIDNDRVRVIDASTAHRVDDAWVYGLPELSAAQRKAVTSARFVANPGCYPTCVALLLRPLTDAGLIAADAPITIHALSGYTGGGRAMVEDWESAGANWLSLPYEAPYATAKRHKHIPEMMRYSGLSNEPQFVPAVGPFRCGMRVEIPLHRALLGSGVGGDEVFEVWRARYAQQRFVRLVSIEDALATDGRKLDPRAHNGSNRVELRVLPHPSGHLLLIAILDNLGKGASGAAVQNLNLMLGLPEDAGLVQAA